MVENAATYDGGWIQVHRKITESEFYHSERFEGTHASLDLLLLAAWKPRTIFLKGVEIHLQRGDLAWSQRELSRRWKWNQRTVNKYLTALEKREMIHHTVSQTTTLIHIINYDTYQTDINASTPRSTARNTARNTARVQHGIQTNEQREQREQREQKDNAELRSRIAIETEST